MLEPQVIYYQSLCCDADHIPDDFLNKIIDSVFDSLTSTGDGKTPVTDQPASTPAAGTGDGNTAVTQTASTPAGTGDKPDTADSQANRTADEPKKKTVTYDQLYEAIVEVFNQINDNPMASWAGTSWAVPNWAHPSKESVFKMLEKSDADQNKEIDRDEFRDFVRQFCRDMVATYAREMMIVTIAVPAVAALTKRATRGVPVVGGLLSKVPNTVFLASASAATLFVRNKCFIKSPGPV